MTVSNISPGSNDRMRILLTKAAETTGRMVDLAKNPEQRARLRDKLAKTEAKIKALGGGV